MSKSMSSVSMATTHEKQHPCAPDRWSRSRDLRNQPEGRGDPVSHPLITHPLGRAVGWGAVPPPGKLVRTSSESWEGGGEVSLDAPSFQCPSLDGSQGQDCRRHVTGSIRLGHVAKLVFPELKQQGSCLLINKEITGRQETPGPPSSNSDKGRRVSCSGGCTHSTGFPR